jgi:membrane protease YdiL (CAAX protease family)
MPPPALDVRTEELRTQPGRTWGVPDAVLAVVAVPLVLAVFVALVTVGLDLPDAALPVAASLVLGVLAYATGQRAARQSGGWRAAIGLDLPEWSDTWRIVGWTVLLVLAQLGSVLLLLLLVPPLRDVEPESNVDFIADQGLAGLLVFAVLAVTVAPVVEEVLFRGVALRGFMLRLGFWPAALLSTTFFALLHVQRPTAGSAFVVASIFPLGLVLCLLARRTGRLGPCIGVHALYNAVVFAFTAATTG